MTVDHINFACKGRPRNDLYFVGWDVKRYSLTHSLMTISLCALLDSQGISWSGNQKKLGSLLF